VAKPAVLLHPRFLAALKNLGDADLMRAEHALKPAAACAAAVVDASLTTRPRPSHYGRSQQ